MTLPHLIPIITMTLFSVAAFAGQDAAQEVQEGNVRQWMEYYERERRPTHEADVSTETVEGTREESSDGKARSGDVDTSKTTVPGADE